MIFFVILGGLFVVIGVWSFFALRKHKRKWVDSLRAQGLEFDQEHQLIRQEVILLNLAEKRQILWSRGANHIKEKQSEHGLHTLPYEGLLDFKAEINHEVIKQFPVKAALLDKATIVRMEINNNEVEKLNINPNDLADKRVRVTLLWWINFLHELAAQNQGHNQLANN